MTTKERAMLKGLASKLTPVAQVGKDGITANVVDSIQKVLKARELIKINVLKNCENTSNEIAIELEKLTQSEIVCVMGCKIVLYKKSDKNIIM